MKMGNNGRFYKIIKATALVIGLALVIVIPVVKWHMRQEAAKIIQEDQQKIFKEAFDRGYHWGGNTESEDDELYSLIKALITSKRGKMMKEIKDIYNMTKEENIFCAKRVLVDSIYKQANLEGIGVTFAETQDILNNVNVDKVTPTDMSKVCCLRDGWHYLFDHLDEPVDLVFLESIHELTARFDVPYQYLGKLRVDDVMISGTDWRPEIPDVETIYRDLQELNRIECITDRALSIGLYIMRTQMFKDGNKRVGSFAANKILIENGRGIFNVPVKYDGAFKQMLVDYYESNDNVKLKEWIADNCLQGTTLVKKPQKAVKAPRL